MSFFFSENETYEIRLSGGKDIQPGTKVILFKNIYSGYRQLTRLESRCLHMSVC